ncbi:alpha/beta fold hydrolase [Tropicimonas sp. IMCC34043]|uniref:alpha/beta fold hydrolase n=1 Tax=Tropicimonas sp. IMCC34043 TaxID=2248760 RepID=UPI00130064FA|nr:alpha/beta fold hydrolase [Tropicimonas sp. IMCC34043]
MARIVLVHGAWGNARSWGRVRTRLRALGHAVEVMDLPGHGADPTPVETVGLASYGRAVAERVSAGEPALLVGHSMGGMAISAAAELAPEAIARLVYVCAFLPRSGESLLDLMRRQPLTIAAAVRTGPVPGTTRLDPELAAGVLFHDASPEQKKAAMAELGVQPNAPQTDKAVLSAERFGRVPRAYILCAQDRTITPALQRAMIADSPCDPVLELDVGHLPQLTAPEELAALIDGLAG